MGNGSFLFMADITQEDTYTGVVSPFFSENDPSSGSISYEIHQGGSSQTILSTVNQIVNQHTNASFNGSWALVATWNNVQQNAGNNVSFPHISKLYHVFPQTNTFQGMLVTDLTTSSYAVFTYHCGDMSFSDPGLIGFTHIKDGVNITHGATYREHPYFVSCLNEQNSDWVNVVYEIAKSGKKLSVSFFTKQSTVITKQRMSVKLTMVAVSRSVQTLSSHSTVTVVVDTL